MALGLLGPLAGAELALRLIPSAYDGARRMPVDGENPIARLEPDREFTWSAGWNFSLANTVQVNNAGFHSDVDYEAGGSGPLLAVVGDSYVEAVQVPYRLSCAGRVATMLEPAARVYSFGLSGAPLSQYLAWARYAHDSFLPRAMVFVIIRNDYRHSVRRSSSMPGFHYFVGAGAGRLVLERSDFVPSLAHRTARRSALLRYLAHNAGVQYSLRRIRRAEALRNRERHLPRLRLMQQERVAISKRAIDEFFDLLPEYSGLGPERITFVLDGVRPDLYDDEYDESLRAARGGWKETERRYFMANAVHRGYETLDLQPRFRAHYRRHRRRFEWPQDHHWNALGHELCSDAVRSSALLSDAFPAAAAAGP